MKILANNDCRTNQIVETLCQFNIFNVKLTIQIPPNEGKKVMTEKGEGNILR